MAMMQPEPSTEFRREKEFRAKIYRMLSLGLSTTEIEALVARKVDWNLFSQETLSEFIAAQNQSAMSAITPSTFSEFFDSILEIRQASRHTARTITCLFDEFIHSFHRLQLTLEVGFFTVLLTLSLLIGVLIFK